MDNQEPKPEEVKPEQINQQPISDEQTGVIGAGISSRQIEENSTTPVLGTDVNNPINENFSLPTISAKPKKPKILLPVLLTLILGLIFALIFLVRFFFKSGPKSSETILTYWGIWEPEPVMQGIIADWEKSHPKVKIKYIQQDKQDYQARLQSAFARGEGPDIFRFHQSWLPALKTNLAPVPQSGVKSLGLEKDYFPMIKDLLSSGSQYYGIPLMVDTLALYYNKDILSSANKSLPRTWWGLEKIAKELTVVTDERINVAGVALGTTGNVDHWSDIIGLMIYQNSGQPGNADSLIEDVLKYYLRFKTINKVWDETLPVSTIAFANNELAFYFAPSWRIFNLLEANPKLNFGITAVPQLPKLRETDWEAAERGEGELTSVGWATFWAEGVWVKGKYQQEAWEFLQFLGSKETLQKLYTAQSQIRLFGEIYPRIDLASSLESDPLLSPFVSQAKVAQSWYLCSSTYDMGVNSRAIKYYEDAINGLFEGEQEAKVLETLDAGMKQLTAQYGIK